MIKMIKAGQFIVDDQGKRYKVLEDPTINDAIYRVKSVWDVSRQQKFFMKFAYILGTEDEYAVNNLKRESGFCFHYPYIEHVIGAFNAKDPNGYDIYCVLLEHIEGENLRVYRQKQWNLVESGDLSEAEFEQTMFRQMMQLLYGINYYMNYVKDGSDKFLHRDLKPENLMIRNGNIIIVDFDYAHVAGSNKTQRLKGWNMGGTAGYTDPIVVKKGISNVQSDIYSLGKILFFWLCGRDYFSKEECEGWQYCYNSHLGYGLDQSRLNKKYRGKTYEKFIHILRKTCLEPEKRYRTITEIMEDMEAFLLDYCGHSMKKMQSYLQKNKMPLLQQDSMRNFQSAPNVRYKIFLPGETRRGKVLLNHAMRDIRIKNRLIMTIYNLDGEIYYIPYEAKLNRERRESDFRIKNEETFFVGDTQIKFWI